MGIVHLVRLDYLKAWGPTSRASASWRPPCSCVLSSKGGLCRHNTSKEGQHQSMRAVGLNRSHARRIEPRARAFQTIQRACGALRTPRDKILSRHIPQADRASTRAQRIDRVACYRLRTGGDSFWYQITSFWYQMRTLSVYSSTPCTLHVLLVYFNVL